MHRAHERSVRSMRLRFNRYHKKNLPGDAQDAAWAAFLQGYLQLALDTGYAQAPAKAAVEALLQETVRAALAAVQPGALGRSPRAARPVQRPLTAKL